MLVHCKDYCCCFLINAMTNFKNNDMPHQFFSAGLQASDIYPMQKSEKCSMGRFLTTKFGLWVDTHPSTDNSHHSRIGQQQIVGFYFRLKKQLKVVMVIPHVMLPVLKVQQLVWQLTTLVEFWPLKSKLDDLLAAREVSPSSCPIYNEVNIVWNC